MTYEELQKENEHLNIQELDLSGVSDLKGLYIDGNIAIHKNLTDMEKACVLAEELGHHYTSSGNILNLNDVQSKKQERTARLWAYNKQIGLSALISAFKANCCNSYDMAEYLGVSEEFLLEALEYYRQIYGTGVTYGKYMIQFEPNLRVHTMMFSIE